MARIETFRQDFVGALSALHGRDARTVGHNTRLVARGGYDGAQEVAVRFHSTDVATFRADGWTVLSSGGWRTTTTADRLRQALPAEWSVYSVRTRGVSAWWLARSGRPVLPFADGIAVHADGRVGFSNRGGEPRELLTADAVADAVAAVDAARADREAKRAARILRQHPAPRPARYVPGANAWTYPAGLTPAHGRARPYDCAACRAEVAEWQALRDAHMTAEHDSAQSLPGPILPETHGRHAEPFGYGPAPDYAPRYRLACPWDCPKRVRNAGRTM